MFALPSKWPEADTLCYSHPRRTYSSNDERQHDSHYINLVAELVAYQ